MSELKEKFLPAIDWVNIFLYMRVDDGCRVVCWLRRKYWNFSMPSENSIWKFSKYLDQKMALHSSVRFQFECVGNPHHYNKKPIRKYGWGKCVCIGASQSCLKMSVWGHSHFFHPPRNGRRTKNSSFNFFFFILIYEYFLINFDLFMMKFISCLISERVSEIKKLCKSIEKNVKSFFLSQLSTKKFFLAHYFQQLSSTQSHTPRSSYDDFLPLFYHINIVEGFFFSVIFCTHFFASNLILSSSSSCCFSSSSFYLIISNDDFYFSDAVFLCLLLLMTSAT